VGVVKEERKWRKINCDSQNGVMWFIFPSPAFASPFIAFFLPPMSFLFTERLAIDIIPNYLPVLSLGSRYSIHRFLTIAIMKPKRCDISNSLFDNSS
jgi:hypothetical protein